MYLDLAGEREKLRNVRGTVIPIVIGALEKSPKDFVKGREDLKIR